MIKKSFLKDLEMKDIMLKGATFMLTIQMIHITASYLHIYRCTVGNLCAWQLNM